MIISIQNKIYTFTKKPYESEDIFYNRIWFIASQEPNTQKELEKYIQYSHIWVNITYNHLTYDKLIMDNIKKYSKNVYKEYVF
jgi:hypothetical protein